jgi:hypothetical protein
MARGAPALILAPCALITKTLIVVGAGQHISQFRRHDAIPEDTQDRHDIRIA